MEYEAWKVKLLAQSACLQELRTIFRLGLAQGMTMSPALLRREGIGDYLGFVRAVCAEFPAFPAAFPVLADEFTAMEREALLLAAQGSRVFVSIPIMNARGESALPLIRRLSRQGVSVDVTAVLTPRQIEEAAGALAPQTPARISVLAGEIADTGVCAARLLLRAAFLCRGNPAARLVWADCRAPYDILAAERAGCAAIAAPVSVFKRLRVMNRSLEEQSLDAVRSFYREAGAWKCANL